MTATDASIQVRLADLGLEEDALDYLSQDLRGHPTARILLAFEARRAVGFATCFLGYSTFRARPLLNIHDIAVLPQHRGRGIGRALLDAIREQALGLGCCKLTLEVREDNPVAAALYRRHGFSAARVDDRTVQYYFLEQPLNK